VYFLPTLNYSSSQVKQNDYQTRNCKYVCGIISEYTELNTIG
jgi:hypothetical protein